MTVRVLVLGDTLLDRDVVGRVDRLCPDAPVPVVDVLRVDERAGGAGLAALLAARTGADVVLATGLGPGRAGHRVRALLDGQLELHDIRPGTPTICKTRVRAHGQSLLRADDEGHLLADDESMGTARMTAAEPPVDTALLRRLLGSCDAVLVSDYGGPVTSAPAVRELLARHASRVPVVWDPHPRGAPPVAGVTVATPNRAAAHHSSPDPGSNGALSVLAAALRARWQVQAVCITDGARGAVTALDGGQVVTVRAVPCPDGIDTCGAGDRFAAGLAVALAEGRGTADAVARAQQDVGRWLRAGGVSAAAAQGTPPEAPSQPDSPTDPPEPRRPDDPAPERPEEPSPSREPEPSVTPDGPLLSSPAPAKVDAGAAVPPSAAVRGVSADELVERVRATGGTVVATGGCFDVLHAGHLALLERARSLGDCLVVLLNSDASVRRLKGPNRPVHAVADRARLLEGLACVDAVAVFEDDDPVATLARLRPHVWVKGGDYREQDRPEARTVRALGGRIELVPYVAGHSTTRILQHADRPSVAASADATTTAPTEGDSR
jgi:rfaE bifunctional protein nucleotidyltransferase chain/domain/rfaE bifunctional protein kinase chain/domain